MKPNYILQAWREKKQTLGGWLSMPCSPVAEVMAHAGFDWLVVDLQHGLIDYKDMLPMLQAIQTTNCVAFVRTTWNSTAEINKVLDAGAQGVVVPLINTPEDAQQAVRSMRYAMSGGIRSTGPTRAAVVLGADYVARADSGIPLLAQIETVEGLRNVDAIAATPGIDCIYLGPTDLAMSMGITPDKSPWNGVTAQWQAGVFDDARHRQACADVLAAARRHGKPAVAHMMGTGATAERLARRLIGEGWDGVMLGSDRQFLGAGVAEGTKAARSLVPAVCPRRGAVDVATLRRLASGEISVDDAAQQLAKL